MRILGIDPGTEQSAMAWLEDGRPMAFQTLTNHDVLRSIKLQERDGTELVVEMIASYGMPVGREVFETCVWIGRFIQAWTGKYTLLYRRDIKLHLCNSARAKDANIAQALRDRFGEKGTKKSPGLLYGIKRDEWAALAVAVTYHETEGGKDVGDRDAVGL